MILKRKNQSHNTHAATVTNPKSKSKQITNKPKNKLQSSASMRCFKSHKNTGQMINHQKEPYMKQTYLKETQNNFNYVNTMHCQKNYVENQQVMSISQVKESRQSKNNNSKLRKSASTGTFKNCKMPRRSLSPGINKQSKEKNVDIKPKYSSKHTSRSEKQINKEKLKNVIKKNSQPKKLHKITTKNNKTQKTARNQTEHLKTDISSRMPSISRQMQKKVTSKKNSKVIKMKDIVKVAKRSLGKSKTKHKIKNSIVFSDVSFNDMSMNYSHKKRQEVKSNNTVQQNPYYKISQLAVKIRSAITIQKHYRGYLTRRFIYQVKQMTFSAIKIQKIWRGYLCRKKLKQFYNKSHLMFKKNLSIQNSLVTIKDFSQQPKEQKMKKFKFFNFQNDKLDKNQSSMKKNQTFLSDKIDSFRQPVQNKRYVRILESLLNQEQLQQKFKQRIRESLKIDAMNSLFSSEKQYQKQNYIKNKINAEIISEKSFNSPRSLCSPKGSITFPSPKSSKGKIIPILQPILQIYSSPNKNTICEKTSQINQRILSPCQTLVTSSIKKNIINQIQQLPIQDKFVLRPFDTTFQFIEEFELIIVDFLRDNENMKNLFLNRVKKCQSYRTQIVLAQWDKFYEETAFEDSVVPKFAYTQEYRLPVLFDQNMKSMILQETAMRNHLRDKNYLQQLWQQNQQQKQAYQGYITLIFNGLTESIYRNYKLQIVTKPTYFYGSIYQGHQLFKFILMNSLTSMQGWCEYLCGMQIPVEQIDPNYPTYHQKNQQRMQLLVNSDLKPILKQQYGSWIFWLIIMIGEIIFQEVVQELSEIQVKRKIDIKNAENINER